GRSGCGIRRYGSLALFAQRRNLARRCGQPVSRCISIPACRHIEIARHAVPRLIKLRQVIFSPRVAMRCRARVPQGGLSRVARRASAAITHHSEVELGEDISGFGGAKVPTIGRCCVLPNSFPKVVEQPEPEGSARITLLGARPPYAQGVNE